MTTREVIQMADGRPFLLAGLFMVAPLSAWLCGVVHGRGHGSVSPWKYFYAGLVYFACVPGILAGVLTGYTLFFSHENLLDVSLLVYVLPVISMIATLALIRRNVDFDLVPGFDRLSGLMVMIGCSFAIALAIQKTRIWIFFGGSIERLIALAVGIFALLKWGTHQFFRRREEPKPERPKFPGL